MKRAEGLVAIVLPDVDGGLGMSAGFELCGVGYLVLERPVGAFVLLVLRRRIRNDLDRRDGARERLVLKGLRGEFGSVDWQRICYDRVNSGRVL